MLAAVAFGWVFARFLTTHLVENMPTLVVSGFTVLAAIQSFFSGLILSDMVTASRRSTELELNRISERKRDLQ